MTAGPDPTAVSPNIWTGFEEDGLECSEIGEHSRYKHQLLAYYLQVFTKAMSKKYPNLVYVDLFAGPGRSRIGESRELIEGSPMIACRTVPPFRRLVLCEADPRSAAALEVRLREFSSLDCRVVPRNCNEAIDEIERNLPPRKGSLTVCFVDPFNLGIHFDTVSRLSSRYIDFVVLLADRMAGSRILHQLIARENTTVEHFLAEPDWRERWYAEETRGKDFDDFLVESFTKKMDALGFMTTAPRRVKVINMGVNLYRLVLSSKSELAIKIWEDACRRAPDQPSLF